MCVSLLIEQTWEVEKAKVKSCKHNKTLSYVSQIIEFGKVKYGWGSSVSCHHLK